MRERNGGFKKTMSGVDVDVYQPTFAEMAATNRQSPMSGDRIAKRGQIARSIAEVARSIPSNVGGGKKENISPVVPEGGYYSFEGRGIGK